MRTRSLSRRQVLDRVGAVVTAPARALTAAQTVRGRGAGASDPSASRLVPRPDLVNTLEFEEQARKALAPAAFAAISGSRREEFDRITLRPRMCVPVLDMNLSLTLFGDAHFAPIIVGPIENQRRFHPDGELATLTGAAAARAGVVVSSHSSVAGSDLTANAKTPLWYQVFGRDPAAGAKLQHAIDAGYRAVCVTIGASPSTGGGSRPVAPTAVDWSAVGTLVRSSSVPVLVKGIATPSAATMAIARGAQGLIASTYNGLASGNRASVILTLPEIVDAAGKVPVLVDGGFRRGTDILKALAFGARAVLIGRPIMWGLAAYGADGVQSVVEMLQTELARYMGMSGNARLAVLDRTLLKVHRHG
jgi:4-hydroxymandelate oxidase